MRTSEAVKFGLKLKDLERMSAIFSKHPEVEKVLVYGSRAKGNFKPYSDMDLTLIGSKIDLTIQNKIENELDDLLLPIKFDVSVFHKIQNTELIDHIHSIGKELFINND